MYICQDCEHTFYEPDKHRGDYGWDTEYGRSSAWQTEYSCPYCGSEYYEEAKYCDRCGNICAVSELNTTDGCTYLCDNCYAEMEDE